MANIKVFGSALVSVAFTGALLSLACSSEEEILYQNINIMIVLCGLSSGWLLGILISPYSIKEQNNFSNYTKAFAVFFSGYLIGKLDKVIGELFQPDIFFDITNGFRALLFISSIVVSMITTFIFRQYL